MLQLQDSQVTKGRASLGSTSVASSSWEGFEDTLFRSAEDSALEGGHLMDTGLCGVGKVIRETWPCLPSDAKEVAKALANKFINFSEPMRVTTLCSGTDGVVDTMKALGVRRLLNTVGLELRV